MKRSTNLLLLPLLLLLITPGCKKDQHAEGGPAHVLKTIDDLTIMVNQEVTIYDSTALYDSLLFFDPPGNRLYKWTITPADDKAVFSGSYTHGNANIIFNQPDNYQVSAEIYDSLGQHLLGHTTQVAIQVLKDSLYPEQAISPDDTLTLTLSPDWSTQGTIVLPIGASTAKSYAYVSWRNGIQYSVPDETGGFSLVFADSVLLQGYPFAFGYGLTAPITEELLLGGFSLGATVPFSVTWLNKTYTGSLTLNSAGAFSFVWPVSVPVVLRQQ